MANDNEASYQFGLCQKRVHNALVFLRNEAKDVGCEDIISQSAKIKGSLQSAISAAQRGQESYQHATVTNLLNSLNDLNQSILEDALEKALISRDKSNIKALRGKAKLSHDLTSEVLRSIGEEIGE